MWKGVISVSFYATFLEPSLIKVQLSPIFYPFSDGLLFVCETETMLSFEILLIDRFLENYTYISFHILVNVLPLKCKCRSITMFNHRFLCHNYNVIIYILETLGMTIIYVFLSIVTHILNNKFWKHFIFTYLPFTLFYHTKFQDTLWNHFHLPQRTSINFSFRTDLKMNYLRSSASEGIFIHFHSWRVFILHIEFWVYISLLSSRWRVSPHCHWFWEICNYFSSCPIYFLPIYLLPFFIHLSFSPACDVSGLGFLGVNPAVNWIFWI